MIGMLSLAIRSLRARPLRTLLSTFAIVLGVAVILATSITNLSTLDSITSLFSEASGKAQLIVVSADGQGFPERTLRQVSTVPGVLVAVPSLSVQTAPADDLSPAQLDVGFFVASARGLVLYGIDPVLDPQAREYRLVAGQFLPPDSQAYDVVLVKDYADQEGVRLGSDWPIRTPGGIERLRVVGLISKEGPGQLNNGAFGVIPLQTAQNLFGRLGDLDQIDLIAAPQAAHGTDLDVLQARLQAQLGQAYLVTYPATQGRRVTEMLDTYQLGLSFFSAIALFVGMFLIYNAFSMTVVERMREIGLLRAIGMTRRQISQQILLEAGILGLVGAALGDAAGLLLSLGLIRATQFILGQDVNLVRVPLDGLLTSTLVGMGVTLIAAAIPAWQAGRISPLEALRIRANARESWLMRRGWPCGAVLLAVSCLVIYGIQLPPALHYRLGQVAVFTLFVGAALLIPVTVGAWERLARPVIRRLYGAEGRLGSGNIRRAKARTTWTASALMVGVAVILGIHGLTGAFEHDIRSWINAYIGGDLYVFSSLPVRTDLGRRLEAVEGVAVATPVRYLTAKQIKPDGGEESIAFMALDPASYLGVTSPAFASSQDDPPRLLGQLAEGNTVFVSSVLAEKYGLSPGGMLRLQTRRGTQDFRIAAIVIDFYNRGMVIQGSWKDLRRYFGVNDATLFFLKLQPGYPVEQARRRLDDLYGQRWHLTVDSNQALKERALRLTAQVFSMFDVLALIAVIVAALGVVNTMTMNVSERTREIGALRGVGMTRRQVGKMILAEAAMIGLIGGVFGLMFGLFLSRVFLMALSVMRGYNLTYIFPTQGLMVSAVIALIVSQLAAILPARRAARLRIVEAIQYE